MTEATIEPPEFEEMNMDDAIAHLRGEQNVGLAVLAGLIAAVVGAVLWAAVVYATNYSTGIMAIVVGALVGYAVRIAGKGIDQQFGVLGAVCAAFGWALGTALADIAMVAQVNNVGFADAAGQLGLGGTIDLFMAAADPMDLLFLAIAVWEGYRFAFRYRI